MITKAVGAVRELWRAQLGRTLIPFFLARKGVVIGDGCRFLGLPKVLLPTGGRVIFGKNCMVISKQDRNLLTQQCRFVLLGDDARNAEIRIGNDVGLSGVTIFCTELVHIRNNVILGSDTLIIDSDFHPLDPEQRLKDRNSGARRGPVVIEENVFVGARSMILRNTTIGAGSVVGAGAVVCGSFPPNSLIAGNPARILKGLGQDSEARVSGAVSTPA